MTKLNHNRPLLRYFDNIRREMAIDARRTDTLSFGGAERSAHGAGCDIFPLSSAETEVVLGFFGSIEHYLDVEIALITAAGVGASKHEKSAARSVSRDEAENRVKSAAVALSARMLLSGLEGRMNLLNLYRQLESKLKADALYLWEFLNDQAMKEAMQQVSKVVESHAHGTR